MCRIREPLHISNQATLVIHLREDEQRRALIKKLRRILTRRRLANLKVWAQSLQSLKDVEV